MHPPSGNSLHIGQSLAPKIEVGDLPGMALFTLTAPDAINRGRLAILYRRVADETRSLRSLRDF